MLQVGGGQRPRGSKRLHQPWKQNLLLDIKGKRLTNYIKNIYQNKTFPKRTFYKCKHARLDKSCPKPYRKRVRRQ